jgi:Glycosyltransferase family 20
MASMGVWISSLYIISESCVFDVSVSTDYLLFCLLSRNSHQTLKKDEFYALLSVADLAVITPLRDGMNITSMEFVIAQERTNKSPSVLSEFMGISKDMEDALLVNPWNLGVCFFFFFHFLVFIPSILGCGSRHQPRSHYGSS